MMTWCLMCLWHLENKICGPERLDSTTVQHYTTVDNLTFWLLCRFNTNSISMKKEHVARCNSRIISFSCVGVKTRHVTRPSPLNPPLNRIHCRLQTTASSFIIAAHIQSLLRCFSQNTLNHPLFPSSLFQMSSSLHVSSFYSCKRDIFLLRLLQSLYVLIEMCSAENVH